MDAQITPHPMPRPVIVIQPRIPQRSSGQPIQLRAGGALGEHGRGKRNQPPQHTGIPVTVLRRGRANGNGPRNIGRPVQILPPRIHQI